MKTNMLFIALLGLMAGSFSACKKNKCEECHYDKDGAEIELGENVEMRWRLWRRMDTQTPQAHM